MFDGKYLMFGNVIAEIKTQELLREAEKNRLISQALAARPKRAQAVLKAVRIWLGHRFIGLGKGLIATLETPDRRPIEFT